MIKKYLVSPLGNLGRIASGLIFKNQSRPNKEKIKSVNTHQPLHG